jgi:hypothetical protein
MATPPNPISTLKADWSWIVTHVLLLVAVGIVVLLAVFGIEELISKHDDKNAAVAQQILAASTAQTNLLASKLSQDEQLWSQQNAANQKIIAIQAAQIAQRNIAAQQQQKVDASLSATDAANRLSDQTGAKSGEVTAVGDTVSISLPVTRTVVQLLDSVPTLQANLNDTQNQLAAETSIAGNLESQVDAQKSLVAAQQIQLADQNKACTAQVAAVKAKARKNGLKWFAIGFVSGFLARVAGA